ncbi:MAG: cyclic nucleotide-binding domain-containing protein [Dehalococcoidia bacterium]|nr:cyclic nucleotide-binding domain-containing protein [Dehalococcoidia bacterium]MDZ4246279.1 cyclic nucleotide-binding domain-containing protein [Dehalococcoidia bacterium]
MKQPDLTAFKRVLKACATFAPLKDADLEEIAGMAVEKEYEAGDTIFRDGDKAREFYIIQVGKVAIQMLLPPSVHSQMGKRLTVDVVNPNGLFGWSAIIHPFTYGRSAICLQKVKALAVDGQKLNEFIKTKPDVGLLVLSGMIRVVTSRLNDTTQILVSERMLSTTPQK